MNETTLLNLQLTLPQINAVLTALGNMPYAQVANLITLIQQQAEEEIKAHNMQSVAEEPMEADTALTAD